MNQNFKEFFNGTPNSAYITVCENTNDSEIWKGLFSDMPKMFDNTVVTSYDVTEMEDESLSIGVIINK